MIAKKLGTNRHNFSVPRGPLLGLLVITGLVLTTAMPILGQNGSTCAAPPLGMVGWWPGDGNAKDITPHDHDGVLHGATFTSGEVGQAFSLEGTDDFVSVPNASALNPTKITVDAWVFVAGADLLGQYYPSIIGKGNVGGGNGAYEDESYAMYLTPTGTVDFLVNVNGTMAGRGTAHGSTLNINAWNFVAGTYDGITVRVYVNGVAGVSDALHAGSINPSPENDLLIGKADRKTPIDSGLPNSFFKGAIDEVELFNRALSVQELDKIQNAGHAGKCKCQDPPVEAKGDMNDDDGHKSNVDMEAKRNCDDNGQTHFGDDSGEKMTGRNDSVMMSGNTAMVSGRGNLLDGTPVSYTAVLVGNQPLTRMNLFSITWTTPAGSVFHRAGAMTNGGFITVPPQ